MSELPSTTAGADFPGDATQPTEEVLKALKSVAAASQSKSESQEEDHAQAQPAPTPTEYDTLKNQLHSRPHDPEGWRRLIDLAESSGEIEKITDTYDAFLEQYPNTYSAQIAYLNHFLGDHGYLETLFKRFLRTSPSVDLWRFYLTYVRRVNTGPTTRDTVRKSYEFALNHVGQDKDSGQIWSEYIAFLKSGETTSTWEEQQKMDALRKVYQRAVQIPLDNVEQLWQDYETFETNLNKITAKKFMADLSPAHMQARTVLRQLQKHLGPLFPPMPASGGRPAIFIPTIPTFSAADRALIGSWKSYLKWEESNPLEIEEKDKATLITRIQGVYRKAVIRMRYYSELWYMAYTWTTSVGKQDEAMVILKAGMEANPSSFLLTFAYVEAQEARQEFADVHATFEKFLGILRADLEMLEAKVNSANSSQSSVGSAGGAVVPLNSAGSITTTAAASGLVEAGIQSTNSSFATQSSDEKPPKSKELAERRTEYGLAWIMYMRFGRRAEGVKSSRTIFGKARKDRWTPWEVYEAAALMEYHCSEDKAVASRIFEKGLDTFSDEFDYVVRYLGFLISICDENNARALFERMVGTFPPEKARPLWERWARYEYQYGELEAAQKIEKRMAEVYPSDPPIKRFAQRHMYLSIDAIAARDLGFAMARQTGATSSASSLGRTETQQSLISNPTPTPSGGHKRPPSPEHRKPRDDGRSGGGDYGPVPKRQRPMSPPPRDRDRGDRWDGPPRRRYSPPPGWDRERDRDAPHPRRSDRDRDDERPLLPSVLSWFVGQLPIPSAFDGPVFRTDDLLNLFRNAVIPSTSSRTKSPPPVPPPRGGGRPPPDYSPYTGPGGGRSGGRRY